MIAGPDFKYPCHAKTPVAFVKVSIIDTEMKAGNLA